MAIKTNTIKCPACGATANSDNSGDSIICEYCGTKFFYTSDDSVLNIKTRSAEEKSSPFHKIDIRVRMDSENERLREKSEKMRNAALVFLVLSFVFIGLFEIEFMHRLGSVCAITSIILFCARPKYDRPTGNEMSQNDFLSIPWGYSGWGIFIIGIFTGGIYWLVGPVLRASWLRRNNLR